MGRRGQCGYDATPSERRQSAGLPGRRIRTHGANPVVAVDLEAACGSGSAIDSFMRKRQGERGFSSPRRARAAAAGASAPRFCGKTPFQMGKTSASGGKRRLLSIGDQSQPRPNRCPGGSGHSDVQRLHSQLRPLLLPGCPASAPQGSARIRRRPEKAEPLRCCDVSQHCGDPRRCHPGMSRSPLGRGDD